MLIAQLSDPHVVEIGQLYQGVVESNAAFAAAIAQINAMDPMPDLVLISGDLVENGTRAEYRLARLMLDALTPPLLIIPGNHDDREEFRRCFADHASMAKTGPLHFAVGDFGLVRIIGLDVTVPGFHHGDMDDPCCDWLENTLAAEPDRPTLIMMHQPPTNSGIACIDAYHCQRGERLAAIVSACPKVERIVCGHIHRFMQVRFGGTILMTAPSTASAIALRLDLDAEPASFIEPPAMLLHHWQSQGLVTHFVPIGTFAGPYPFF